MRRRDVRRLRIPGRARPVFLVAVFLVIVAAIELASWGAFYTAWRTRGTLPIARPYVEAFRPLELKNEYEQETVYHPYYLTGFKPNLPLGRYAWGTDRHGLPIHRPNEAARDLTVKPARERVVVLGGSTVMGSGSRTTLGAFLADHLDARAPGRYEIITAGHSGFQSSQELARFLFELLAYRPALVVTFDGVNDAFHGVFVKPERRWNHLRYGIVDAAVERAVYPPLMSLAGLSDRFYSYHLTRVMARKVGVRLPSLEDAGTMTLVRRHFRVHDATYRPVIVEDYLGNLRALSAVAGQRGIRALHVLQPTLAADLGGAEPSPAEAAVLRTPTFQPFLTAQEAEVFVAKRREAYTAFYVDARRGFAEAEQTRLSRWVDLSRFFEGTRDLSAVYYDVVHYRDSRTAELADAVGRELLRWRERPGS